MLTWKWLLSLISDNQRKEKAMLKKTLISMLLASTITACGPNMISTTNANSNKLKINSNALTVAESYPIQGSESVSVHAYSYVRTSPHCSRTVAIQFSSALPYTQTLTALRNRALVTGANAIAITDWHENSGITTLTSHFFDCHSKKGL